MSPTVTAPPLAAELQAILRRFGQQISSVSPMQLERMAAQGILAVLDGSPAHGRTLLHDAACMPERAGSPPGAVLTLVIGALICGDMDLVSHLVAAFHGPDLSVRVTIVDRISRTGVVGCTIGGPQSLSFALSEKLFEAPGFITLVNRWFTTVPMFVRAAGFRRSRGHVALHLIDGAFRPGLGFCTRSDEVTLVPDPDFMRSHGYLPMRQHMQGHALPWEIRRPLALWRGSPNGYPEPGQGWQTLPRVRLCTLAAARPDLFDAGLTAKLPAQNPGHAALADSGLMRDPIDSRKFQAYRYQIDIDGYTNAWSGLFIKLLTGSAVLKVQSAGGWRQWYYDLLKPWTHYVPVASDLSDLVEKTSWLAAHDARAVEIGTAGRALAESLTYERQLDWAAGVVARVLA